MKKSANNLIG